MTICIFFIIISFITCHQIQHYRFNGFNPIRDFAISLFVYFSRSTWSCSSAHIHTHTQSKKTLILMSLIKSNNIQIYGFIALEWIIITKIRPTNSHCVYLLVRPIWSRVDWCYDIRYTSTEMVPTKTRIQRDVMKIQLGQIYIIQLLYGYHRISLITIENRFFPLSARAPQAWQAVC